MKQKNTEIKRPIEESLMTLDEKADLDFLKKLQEKEVDIEYIFEDGHGILHHVACKGYLKSFKYLVEEKGKDPSCLNAQRISVLHCAASSGHLNLVKYLVEEKNLNPYLRDYYSASAIEYAYSANHIEVARYLNNISKLFIKRQSYCNIKFAKNVKNIFNKLTDQLLIFMPMEIHKIINEYIDISPSYVLYLKEKSFKYLLSKKMQFKYQEFSVYDMQKNLLNAFVVKLANSSIINDLSYSLRSLEKIKNLIIENKNGKEFIEKLENIVEESILYKFDIKDQQKIIENSIEAMSLPVRNTGKIEFGIFKKPKKIIKQLDFKKFISEFKKEFTLNINLKKSNINNTNSECQFIEDNNLNSLQSGGGEFSFSYQERQKRDSFSLVAK